MVASTRHPIRPLFDLGQLGATPGALGLLAGTFGPDAAAMLTSLLRRHVTGDWGDLDEEDRRDNDAAVRHGTRVFSAYRVTSADRVWIITEADRSVTTVLLPEEY